MAEKADLSAPSEFAVLEAAVCLVRHLPREKGSPTLVNGSFCQTEGGVVSQTVPGANLHSGTREDCPKPCLIGEEPTRAHGTHKKADRPKLSPGIGNNTCLSIKPCDGQIWLVLMRIHWRQTRANQLVDKQSVCPEPCLRSRTVLDTRWPCPKPCPGTVWDTRRVSRTVPALQSTVLDSQTVSRSVPARARNVTGTVWDTTGGVPHAIVVLIFRVDRGNYEGRSVVEVYRPTSTTAFRQGRKHGAETGVPGGELQGFSLTTGIGYLSGVSGLAGSPLGPLAVRGTSSRYGGDSLGYDATSTKTTYRGNAGCRTAGSETSGSSTAGYPSSSPVLSSVRQPQQQDMRKWTTTTWTATNNDAVPASTASSSTATTSAGHTAPSSTTSAERTATGSTALAANRLRDIGRAEGSRDIPDRALCRHFVFAVTFGRTTSTSAFTSCMLCSSLSLLECSLAHSGRGSRAVKHTSRAV
ncbi:hypothetical protein Bbelb_394750 [Branchiostoma belcheri]|nr:hypothetical protein Bbelb_394750 [Branchiostoma belcheri]